MELLIMVTKITVLFRRFINMITKETVSQILDKPVLTQGLEKYKYIMNAVHTTNVSADMEFQNCYRDFYQLRRFYSDEFAKKYFNLMEKLKEMPEVSFQMAFEQVKNIQGTDEISFSSKLAHTLSPDIPVWDSVVTNKHFGIKAPTGTKEREQKIFERYRLYCEKYFEYLKSEEGQMLVAMFDETFPDAGISDVKKIDFILWQDR